MPLADLLRAEFTKFRTLPGRLVALGVVIVATVLLALAAAAGSTTSCGTEACPAPPRGPGGEVVTDKFAFAHRTLAGDGTLTARVTSLTGILTYPPPNHDQLVPGVVPWAKAGIMVKDGTKPGAAYASVLLTGAHGVRMQHNFTADTAGPATARWLRLDRRGDSVVGYASVDGQAWTTVGTARLAGLPDRVEIGLFVASPAGVSESANAQGGSIVQGRFTQATAVFDQVTPVFEQVGPAGALTFTEIGRDGAGTDWERNHKAAGLKQAGGAFTLTGSGDVAPAGLEGGIPVEGTLIGVIVALLVVIVVGARFVTAEYRRGLIRTTLIAMPGRHRVLAAKAVVLGAATFTAGLVAVAIALPWGVHALKAGGNFVLDPGLGTTTRVVVGSALLLALTAVLAYALGVLLRRGVPAVLAAIVLVVIPYVLATGSLLPAEAGRWLLRVTPAAGFAIQQTLPAYAQVQRPYSPWDGYFPLAPWAGLAVLAGWTAVLLGVAALRLRRRDA